MYRYWTINQEKSDEYHLELHAPDGQYGAIIKPDGCIRYSRYQYLPPYTHFCGMLAEIERMKELATVARDWFAIYSSTSYWNSEKSIPSDSLEALGLVYLQEGKPHLTKQGIHIASRILKSQKEGVLL